MLWSTEKHFFDQPVKNYLRTYNNIRKNVLGQGHDYTSGCLLDYFKECYNIVTIDLSKQQQFDADPKAIQQINFTSSVDREGNRAIFVIIAKLKEIILDFFTRNSEIIVNLFYFNIISL